jgi:hypothetical protein
MSGKYLDTGVSIPGLSQFSIGMGVWRNAQNGENSIATGLMGSSYTPTGASDIFILLDRNSSESMMAFLRLADMCPALLS